MFEHTSKDGRIIVYETSSDFQIALNETGETHGMGDGVDMYSTPEGKSVIVGTHDFYETLRNDIDQNTDDFVEAYFGGGRE